MHESRKTELSVIAPLYNESENLYDFYNELIEALDALALTFEIIFVDDGSTDNSAEILADFTEKNKNTIAIILNNNSGKASALDHGIHAASGPMVVIIDTDLQYDPADISRLISKYREGYDVVSGMRLQRKDGPMIVGSSRIYNNVIRLITGLRFEDYFCGLKLFSSGVISRLGTFGDLNRIFSVYAARAGYKVCEIGVEHRPRQRGRSRYNFFNRLTLAIFDLLCLFFTVTIDRKKVYFLGLLGTSFLSIGALISVSIILFFSDWQLEKISESNVLKVGIALIFLGWQFRLFENVLENFYRRHEWEIGLRMKNVSRVLGVQKTD
jgi:glycosyltransferase involved in cell wall biosynthesis